MRSVRHIIGSSGGFTLVELLISISILTVVVGIFGAGMFQVLSIQRFWTADVKAVREVRNAASWLSGDALNATDVWDDGGVASETRLTCAPSPSVEEITLTWTDQAGVTHDIIYNVTSNELRRDNGTDTPLVLATGVVTDFVSFTLCGSILKLSMEVQADRDTTDNLDLITYLRKLS